MRDHGIATAEGILRFPQRMVFRTGLGKPNIAAVSIKMAALERLSNVFFHDDGPSGGVDKIRSYELIQCPVEDRLLGADHHTFLHLGYQFFVEHALCLLVKRAVDRHDITLLKHLLQRVYTSASNLFLNLWFEWLVVEV